MGTNISTVADEEYNNITQSALNACPNVNQNNTIDMSGVNFDPPSGCPDSSVTIDQQAVITADCAISSLQAAIATAALSLSVDNRGGLGFNIGTTVAETQNNISSITTNTCADQNQTNVISLTDVNFGQCNVSIIQSATDYDTCQINATQNMVASVAHQLAVQNQGFLGGLFGSTAAIIAAIIIVVLLLLGIGFGAWYLLKGKGGAGESGTDLGATHLDTSSGLSESISPATSDLLGNITKGLGGLTGTGTGTSAAGELVGELVGGAVNNFKKNKFIIILLIIVLFLIVVFISGPKANNNISNDIANIDNRDWASQYDNLPDNQYYPDDYENNYGDYNAQGHYQSLLQ